MITKNKDIGARLDHAIGWLLCIYASIICFPVSYGNAVIDVALFLLALRVFIKGNPGKLELGLLRAFGLMLAVVVLSAVMAENSSLSWQKVWHYFYYSAPLFLGLWFVSTSKIFRNKLILLLPISIAVVSLSLVVQGFQGVIRPGMFLGEFVHIAGQFSILLPLLLVIALFETRLKTAVRIYLISVIVVAMIALVFSATRGAWVAIGSVILGLMIFSLWRRPKMALIILCVLLIIFSIAAVAIKNLNNEQASAEIFRGAGSVFSRVYLWQSAARMIIDHPLLGVGVGNFSEQFGNKYVMPDGPERSIGHAHNTPINIFAENGLLGFGAYIYLSVYIFRHYLKKYRQHGADNAVVLAMLFALIGMHMQGMSDVNFIEFPVVMQTAWFLTGLTWRNV